VICQPKLAGQVQGRTLVIFPPNGTAKEAASVLLAGIIKRIKITIEVIKKNLIVFRIVTSL